MIQTETLTWPAFPALAKTVTRRQWKPRTRAWYQRGRVFDCYDRAAFHGGRLLARARCTCNAYEEPIADMPDEDWEGEGFKWMNEHPVAIPEKARECLWSAHDCSFHAFELWRVACKSLNVVVTVCRFEIVHVEDWAIERLEQILAGNGVLKV